MANTGTITPSGFFGAEDAEMMEKKSEKIYRKHREMSDMMKMMKEMGIAKFREMFGQDMIDELKALAAAENRLQAIRDKILLQGKLKNDFPMCEKCEHWKSHSMGGGECPYDNEKYEKCITFDTGEISQNEFPVEVCEMFSFSKSK